MANVSNSSVVTSLISERKVRWISSLAPDCVPGAVTAVGAIVVGGGDVVVVVGGSVEVVLVVVGGDVTGGGVVVGSKVVDVVSEVVLVGAGDVVVATDRPPHAAATRANAINASDIHAGRRNMRRW